MKKLLLTLIVLAGCQVGPRYNPPETYAPEDWKNSHLDAESAVYPQPDFCNWWEVFEDEKLNELEAQAVANNPTLMVAMARIEEAWALVGIARSKLYPVVNFDPSYSNTGELFKLYLPQSAQKLFPAGAIPQAFRVHQMQFGLPLSMNYEIDLWGKYRSLYHAAGAYAQAEKDAYYGALLTLTTDLATSYYTLRYLDALIDILQDTLKTRQKDYELTLSRFHNGLATNIDVSNAALQVTNTESDYFNALNQRGVQEDLIGSLVGLPASEFELPHMPLEEDPPAIPPGLPSDMIRRRPDIAEAERNMAASHQLINAAWADYFPSLSVTGALGFLSPDFHQFLQWISRYWTYAVNINQTVFDAGRKLSTIDLSYSLFTQEVGNYQQTVLTAFKEVEDALTKVEYDTKQEEVLKLSVGYASQTAMLSKERYLRGVATYTEVVDNQRQELQAKQNYIMVLGQRYQDTVSLIKALGGDWRPMCD